MWQRGTDSDHPGNGARVGGYRVIDKVVKPGVFDRPGNLPGDGKRCHDGPVAFADGGWFG